MVNIMFVSKLNDLDDIIKALENIKIICEKISESSAIIIMPENYFEIFSYTLEYFGKITII